MHAYRCLHLGNRIQCPSVKNFVLDDHGKTPMLFGKVSNEYFALDFDPRVLTCVQAFALALSAFERKYGL